MREVYASLSVLIVTAILLSGCEILDPGTSGVADPEVGKIVVGKSIEGISPGMTAAEVEGILGTPSIGRGDFAGFIYYYGEGSGSAGPVEISILFADEYDGRVVAMTVAKPYPGKTSEGLGIGSPDRTVRFFLGEPDTNVNTVWWGGGLFVSDGGMVYGLNEPVTFIFSSNSQGTIVRISMMAKVL